MEPCRRGVHLYSPQSARHKPLIPSSKCLNPRALLSSFRLWCLLVVILLTSLLQPTASADSAHHEMPVSSLSRSVGSQQFCPSPSVDTAGCADADAASSASVSSDRLTSTSPLPPADELESSKADLLLSRDDEWSYGVTNWPEAVQEACAIPGFRQFLLQTWIALSEFGLDTKGQYPFDSSFAWALVTDTLSHYRLGVVVIILAALLTLLRITCNRLLKVSPAFFLYLFHLSLLKRK
ncbi:unnamed protein product [Protopolystoma xenopodis]|uniref:Transmembrane protein n=1 Tax=Protopolystoma xenopodis TaxID=117903 RepID=A0A3S5AIR4_9PLAT|nr:unnamed protein product [Protopolystoma xenopodis]